MNKPKSLRGVKGPKQIRSLSKGTDRKGPSNQGAILFPIVGDGAKLTVKSSVRSHCAPREIKRENAALASRYNSRICRGLSR